MRTCFVSNRSFASQNLQAPVFRHRHIVLRNLIPLGKIWIIVLFAIPFGEWWNLQSSATAVLSDRSNACAIHHW